MRQSQRTLQEYTTSLAPEEVLQGAKTFFARRNPLYAAFPEREGPGYCTFRGQGGEEIVMAATTAAGGTRVTASSYLFDMQVARFLATLPPYQLGEGMPSASLPDAPTIA